MNRSTILLLLAIAYKTKGEIRDAVESAIDGLDNGELRVAEKKRQPTRIMTSCGRQDVSHREGSNV